MKQKIQEVQKYFQEALSVEISPKPWKKEEALPFFLRDAYQFYQFSLLEHPCILMLAKNNEDTSPGKLDLHLKKVREKGGKFCIYASTNISSYNRKRFIGHHIPFVLPNKQLYLPDLGIDFREHFQKFYESKKQLSPATQVVLLYALLHPETSPFLPSELAKKLGYTAMTMTRAFNELEVLRFGKTTDQGKERPLHFEQTGKALWDACVLYLRNPVKKRVWVKLKRQKHPKIFSGFTALSELTMLDGPMLPIYALSMKNWEIFRKTEVLEELPFSDEADAEIEIWSYDPTIFAKNGFVDPASLYLSLRENQDPRVEIALSELTENFPWSKD